jgi:DNA repair exonuclease SbcCD ATPase subunit
MLALKELRLRNYLLFQEQDFRFENGLTVIQGRNRSGKSLLLSSISGMLHGMPAGESFPKGSHVELELARITPESKTNLRICASSPKSKPDWEFFVNKKDMATHRKKDVRALIDRYVPITDDLFHSTGHIIAGKAMPLFQGTPAVKLDWMSSVFNLAAKYSNMTDLVSAKLEKLQKEEIRLDVLRQQIQTLPEPVDEASYSALKKKYDSFSERIKSWSELSRLNEELQALKKLLSAIEKRKTDVDSEDELQEEIAACKKLLKKAEGQEEARQEYRDACADYKTYIERKEAILAKLPKEIKSPKDAETLLRLTTKVAEHAKSELALADELNSKRMIVLQARKELAKSTKPGMTDKQARLQFNKSRERIMFLNGLIRKVNNVTDDTCPECGTPLTKKHMDEVLERYQKQVLKHTRLQDDAQDAVLYYDLKETAEQEIREIDAADLEAQLMKASGRIKLLEKLLDLKRVAKPEKPKIEVIDVDKLRKKLSKLESDLHLLQAHGRSKFPSQKKCEERIAELETQLDGFETDKMELLSEKTMHVGEQLQELRVRRSRYNDTLRRNKEIQDEIAPLERSIRKIRPLRALKDAFSRSGIVLTAMNDVIEHLLQELNDLVPRLIGEQFRIDIVTGPRKLNVMIERNGVVGSLRTLSMSEQRCWQLLFATAMIRILPNNMLVDTIILDELESNMDEHNRKLYTTEFLPYLQTLVSKVIVISPLIRGELSMQPDRAFLVEKKNKVSSLRQL